MRGPAAVGDKGRPLRRRLLGAAGILIESTAGESGRGHCGSMRSYGCPKRMRYVEALLHSKAFAEGVTKPLVIHIGRQSADLISSRSSDRCAELRTTLLTCQIGRSLSVLNALDCNPNALKII
jgi:hypothetical protein